MLSIKELQVLRHAIDYVKPENFEEDDYDLLQKARNKICDMITLKYAWNRGKRIEMEDDLLI